MKSKESLSYVGYATSVKILDVEKRYKPGPKHYVYVIQVTWSNPDNIFIIYRRYAQFFDLQCKLLDLFAELPVPSNNGAESCRVPFLPGKIILGRSQVRQIAIERKQVLDEYCQKLISLPESVSRSRPMLEFFHPSPTDVQKPIELIMNEKKPPTKSSITISGPSKLESYRCLEDFVTTDKLEMSLKRNDIVQVLKKHENGWWFVQKDDQTGFVPGAYLKPSELVGGVADDKTSKESLNTIYVVNQQYEGKGSDELSLDQGSFVIVIEKSFSGWWTVKFNNLVGQFPAIYLSSCEGLHTPENLTNHTSNATSQLTKTDDSDDSDWDDDDDFEYPITSSNNNKPEYYIAHTDYNDSVVDCASFQRGDMIEIYDKNSSGWWLGRRMNSGQMLTWLPSNYLQQEPLVNTSIDSKSNSTTNNDEHQLNQADIVSDTLTHKQDTEKEKISTDTIYENLDSQVFNELVHAKVTKPSKAIEPTIIPPKASPTPVSIPSTDNYQDLSQPKSVKELVKKFNAK